MGKTFTIGRDEMSEMISFAEAQSCIEDYKKLDSLVGQFIDRDKVRVTAEFYKAFKSFFSSYLEKHNVYDAIRIVEVINSRCTFGGSLEPLNNMDVNMFIKLVINGFEVGDEIVVAEEIKIELGDIVKLDKDYYILDGFTEDGTCELWNEEFGRKKNIPQNELQLLTDKSEIQIGKILANWYKGMRIETYDADKNLTFNLMVIKGSENDSFKLVNMGDFIVIEESETSTAFNIAYFIVKTFEPSEIDIF